MKRKLTLILAIMSIAVVGFFGCGEDKKKEVSFENAYKELMTLDSAEFSFEGNLNLSAEGITIPTKMDIKGQFDIPKKKMNVNTSITAGAFLSQKIAMYSDGKSSWAKEGDNEWIKSEAGDISKAFQKPKISDKVIKGFVKQFKKSDDNDSKNFVVYTGKLGMDQIQKMMSSPSMLGGGNGDLDFKQLMGADSKIKVKVEYFVSKKTASIEKIKFSLDGIDIQSEEIPVKIGKSYFEFKIKNIDSAKVKKPKDL